MTKIFEGDIYAGLSGLELEDEFFEIGEGITLKKIYAHLMAPFMVAFKPAPPGEHHPTPWKAVAGGRSVDVNAELLIPSSIEEQYGSKIAVAKTLVFLLRLRVNPATSVPVFSNYSFSSLPEIPDGQAILFPYEVQSRHFPLGVVGGKVDAEAIEWVSGHWQTVHRLTSESTNFSLAIEAYDRGQFVQNTDLTMISLWGALEALFSPALSEPGSRISSLIAAYVEAPGHECVKCQKEIVKLYEKRSVAARGETSHNLEELLDTFNLLRRVLVTMIEQKKVPSKDILEQRLFDAESHEDSKNQDEEDP